MFFSGYDSNKLKKYMSDRFGYSKCTFYLLIMNNGVLAVKGIFVFTLKIYRNIFGFVKRQDKHTESKRRFLLRSLCQT